MKTHRQCYGDENIPSVTSFSVVDDNGDMKTHRQCSDDENIPPVTSVSVAEDKQTVLLLADKVQGN
jgi:hypothetical protein